MAISQDEIVSNAQTVTKGLEALRSEHQAILGGMKKTKESSGGDGGVGGGGDTANSIVLEEKCGLIEKSLEMIDLGLDEAHVMSALASHLQSVEAEKQVSAHARTTATFKLTETSVQFSCSKERTGHHRR
jgi:kinesin light chain